MSDTQKKFVILVVEKEFCLSHNIERRIYNEISTNGNEILE